MRNLAQGSAIALFFIISTSVVAAPPPLEDFARSPAVQDVGISADGRYLSSIAERGPSQRAVVVADRTKGGAPRVVLIARDTDDFDVSWCGWANASRLLCGFTASVLTDAPSGRDSFTVLSAGKIRYATTRLVGVNADGTDMKVLVQNSFANYSQFQDRILDWTPDEPDTVLIELDEDGDSFPAVFELNVYSGKLNQRMPAQPPIHSFYSDKRGQIRLGVGTRGTKISYHARLLGENTWRTLSTVEAFAKADTLEPLAVLPGKNRALALGDSNGRQALWEIDLEDKEPPKVVFQDPQFDVDRPIMAAGDRLVGVYYEADRPHAYYTEPRARSVIAGSDQFLPGAYNSIYDYTPDSKVYVIRSSSDIDYGSYHLLDVSSGKGELVSLGSGYPELAKQPLPRLETIEYTARDGTRIPGYLTVPAGAEKKNLPLIVMPHGGPVSRDSWSFDFLRLFLASRGYAVLQMNFRGSDGYGWDWFHAAHQDWGGLTYDDIVDGARWAVSSGTADPKRMCIVGWSFGGYAALLGAVRNGADLFRCAVSIAGVSDLIQLRNTAEYFTNSKLAREQIGSDHKKLLEDSPLRHASEVKVPVLLIHGEEDYTVPAEHTVRMAAALRRADKRYEMVMIKKADHYLEWPSERITLLTAVEKFLATNLAAP